MKKLIAFVFVLLLAMATSSCHTVDVTNIDSDTGLHPVKTFLWSFGYIDSQGRMALYTKYNDAMAFSEGLSAVSKRGDWGYIDKSGAEIIPCQYLVARGFKDGYAIIAVSKRIGNSGDFLRYGVINKQGEIIVEPEYPKIADYSEGLAAAGGMLYGYLNEKGEEAIPFQYLNALSFHDGLAAVKRGENDWIYIDRAGKQAISSSFTMVSSFSEGVAAATGRGGWGFIDHEGRFVIQPQYYKTGDFSEGLAWVCNSNSVKDRALQFIDKGGKIKFTVICNKATRFSEGMCPVAVYHDSGHFNYISDADYTWGFVDNTGKLTVDYQYDSVSAFVGGIAQVVRDGKIGYIDKAGKYIWEPK